MSSVFERLGVLADSTRGRLLLLLERHELSVGELCAVLQLPQSTVSRHLKVLADQGWVSSRAEGTSRLYRVAAERQDAVQRRLWKLVREELSAMPPALQDAQRLGPVLAERRSRAEAFFSTAAGEWDRLREELFGRSAELLGLLAMVDPDLEVGDLGCGTGHVAAALAPFVRRVVGVDGSPEMLAAARQRLGDVAGVELRPGSLEALPLEDASLDVALLFLVLHYVTEPGGVLREVARVLRPGGRLVLLDMVPHDREEYRHRMGHLWLGFGEDRVEEMFGGAGLRAERYVVLPAEVGARGPLLFAATAHRKQATVGSEKTERYTRRRSDQ